MDKNDQVVEAIDALISAKIKLQDTEVSKTDHYEKDAAYDYVTYCKETLKQILEDR